MRVMLIDARTPSRLEHRSRQQPDAVFVCTRHSCLLARAGVLVRVERHIWRDALLSALACGRLSTEQIAETITDFDATGGATDFRFECSRLRRALEPLIYALGFRLAPDGAILA